MAELVQDDLAARSFNANRSVQAKEGIVLRTPVSAQRRAAGNFMAVILLGRIHAAFILRATGEIGKLVLNGSECLCKHIKGFISRACRRSGLQSLKELLQSFRLRDHGMTLAKRIPMNSRKTFFLNLKLKFFAHARHESRRHIA